MEILEFDLAYYDEIMRMWKNAPEIGISTADSKDALERFLLKNRGLSFMAKIDTTIVGTILCGHDTRRGFMYHFFVLPQYRNKGIGKNLIENSLAQLQKEGIEKCHILVFSNNHAGIEIWKKLRFVTRDNLVVMSRELEHIT